LGRQDAAVGAADDPGEEEIQHLGGGKTMRDVEKTLENLKNNLKLSEQHYTHILTYMYI